jgi:hypothetical protein
MQVSKSPSNGFGRGALRDTGVLGKLLVGVRAVMQPCIPEHFWVVLTRCWFARDYI